MSQLWLEGENVNDQICFAVQQNDVATDQAVRAIRRRRRQTALQLDRDRIQAFLQARGKGSVANQLFFETGRQAILLGEAWRKTASTFRVPTADCFSIVVVAVRVVVIPAVITVVLVMSLAVAMPLTVALGNSRAT